MSRFKSPIDKAVASVRSVAAWSVMTGNTVPFASSAIGLSLVDPGGFKTYYLGKTWAQVNLRLIRSSLVVSGRENVAPGQPYVAMVNHRSHVDIWAVYAALPLSIRWVMKQELRKIPIFGYCCERMGHLYVQRGNSESARKSMEQAARSIATGTTVVFFPEGTRSTGDEMLPFKSGGFRLALEAQVPVLPVSIDGTRDVLPSGEWRYQPGQIRIVIGAPIPTEGRGPDARHALMDETRAAIEQGLQRARTLA